MRLIVTSVAGIQYEAHLPNHVDLDDMNKIFKNVEAALPDGEIMSHYYLNGDCLTNEEKIQIDIHGEIVKPFNSLNVSIY